MDHSDIDHENMTSAYLKVLGLGQKEELDETRIVTKDGKFVVMTDNDTEAGSFEDRESALEYIKNNKDKLTMRDDKAKPATKDVAEKDVKEDNEKDFEPHMMYDPKTGKGYKANKYADHVKMKKMGYTHDDPKTKKVEESVQFVVPEEITDTKERTAFMGAAAAAHKAGKSHFNFAGKKHPVTIKKDTAKAVNSSTTDEASCGSGRKSRKEETDDYHYSTGQPLNKKKKKVDEHHDKPEEHEENVKENKQAALMKKLSKTAQSSAKGKAAVSLAPTPFLKKKEDKPKKVGRGSEIVKYEDKQVKSADKRPVKVNVGGKEIVRMEPVKKRVAEGINRENWLLKLKEKQETIITENSIAPVPKPTKDIMKKSPHAGGDDTRDSFAKQLSTRKGEADFVKMHEPQTPEFADTNSVIPKTFKAYTAGVKDPKYRHTDNGNIGDKKPVAPVDVGKAGAVGPKD